MYGFFIDFLMISLLTKTLGAYGYGLWTQVSVAFPFFGMVFTLGMPFSVKRLFPDKEMEKMGEDLSSLLFFLASVSSLFALVLFIFPDILAETIFDGHTIIVQIMAFMLFTHTMNALLSSVFRAFREMKKLEIINIIKSTAKIGFIGLVVFLGYELIGVLLAILFVWCGLLLVLFYLVRNKLPLGWPKLSSLKEYLSLGLPTIPAGLASVTVIISDRYLIGIFLGTTEVGYYAPPYSIGEIAPKFLAGVLGIVLLPALSGYYEAGQTAKVKKVLHLSTKYFLMFSVPLIAGFGVVGREFLSWFTTPEIAANGYIILILSSIVGLLMGLEVIFVQGVYLKKRTKLIGIFWAIAAFLNLTGNIIFLPRIGILAAGITSVLSYIVVTGLVIIFTRKKLSYSMEHVMITKIFFSAGLMTVVLVSIRSYVWENLLFSIFIGIALHIIFLYLFRVIGEKEIDLIKNLR